MPRESWCSKQPLNWWNIFDVADNNSLRDTCIKFAIAANKSRKGYVIIFLLQITIDLSDTVINIVIAGNNGIQNIVYCIYKIDVIFIYIYTMY